MSTAIRRELLATIGAPAQRLMFLFLYLYGLGGSLAVGSAARNPISAGLAASLWAAGDLGLVIGFGACLAKFATSVHELRLPNYTSLMLRNYALLGVLLIVAPIALFRILIPWDWRLIGITAAMPVGLLWPRLAQFVRKRAPARTAIATRSERHPIHAPSDVIRVYLGSAFAPVSASSGIVRLRLVVGVLWCIPLVVMVMRGASPIRWFVPLYLGISAALLWICLMAALVTFIARRRAAFADLALLPRLGNPASQRRAFYRAVLLRPMCVCVLFSLAALLWTWSSSHSLRTVWLLGLWFTFLTLIGGESVLSQLLVKAPQEVSKPLRVYALSVHFYMLATTTRVIPVLPESLTSTYVACLLFIAALMSAVLWSQTSQLARHPHPFLP